MSRAFRFNGKPSACYRDFFLRLAILGLIRLSFFLPDRQNLQNLIFVGMKWVGNGVFEVPDTDKNAKIEILSV